LIWGASDRYLPPAYAQDVAARLPRARLELLPACGHVPQRECPERLLALLEPALTSPPRL
jgi:pimeloyl-ACP methyl ester carboxylesterase